MHQRSSQTGAILLVVILLIALLAAIALSFVITMRSHTKATANRIDAVRAEVLANSGVSIAILALNTDTEDGNGEENWAFGTGNFQCITPDGALAIWIEDEGGKIDLNAAPQPLLAAAFEGIGYNVEAAQRTATAIIDFRDADDRTTENGAELDDYLRTNLSHTPKNRPFESADELAQVLGVSPASFNRLRGFVTVHSRRPGIDTAVAPAGLLALLSKIDQVRTPSAGHAHHFDQDRFPTEFFSPSSRSAFRIVSQAQTNAGGLFTRSAIVLARSSSLVFVEWGVGAVRDWSIGPTVSPC